MPDPEDSLGGETFSGEEQQDPAEQSLGDGATMGGDTAAHSLGDQSTFGDANVDDELFDDGMKLEDLSERYTEEGVLGKGGMGEVILATDTRLGRKVAIKRILGKAARSKTAVQRFLTEAKSMAELSHPNIVQIYDYGRATDGPFLIMECVQGGSLLEKCKAGPIELDEAVNIFGQLCDGLTKAHAAGIIHRDIKPANVLMTEDGIPKLTDFGLAKDDTADTGMTMEGAVIGTLDFMPPEQRQAAELTDHRSDLWSLAATFYQMLTGKSPKVINIASLPPKLQSAVAKALEESKEDRFQSAMEMREAILQVHSGKMDTNRSLGEGECPQCATTNPSHGKFCIECSAVLQVRCLKCEVEIQIWNKACGDCGAQQTPLVEKALADLKRIHNQAESLLADLEFDTAVEKAAVIASETDSRLQQYADWYEEFLARIESKRTSEHARLEELLRETLAHEQAYDYEAGLQTLEQVAPSLKQTTVTGSEGTAEEITRRLTTKKSRLKELEGIVRERVTKRQITGLLPIVNELLTLNPDRPEVQKLKAQLEKRGADLLEARDAAVNKATQELAGQQYAEAVATLNTVPEEVSSEQLEDLKTKASASLNQLNDLRDRITTAVNGNQLKGLLPAIEECLTLKADQDDLVKLKQILISREAQMDARNQQIMSQAQQCMQKSQFDVVVQILETIAPEHQTSTTTVLSQRAHQLLVDRQRLLSSVPIALSYKNHQVAIKSISQYLGRIAMDGIHDPQLIQMLDEAKGKESASIRNMSLHRLAITASILLVISGVVFKNWDTINGLFVANISTNSEDNANTGQSDTEKAADEAKKKAADEAKTGQTAAEKAAAEKAAADKKAADKIAADKMAVDMAAADKKAADKIAADKMAVDMAAAARIATNKMAADMAAAARMAADKKRVAMEARTILAAIRPVVYQPYFQNNGKRDKEFPPPLDSLFYHEIKLPELTAVTPKIIPIPFDDLRSKKTGWPESGGFSIEHKIPNLWGVVRDEDGLTYAYLEWVPGKKTLRVFRAEPGNNNPDKQFGAAQQIPPEPNGQQVERLDKRGNRFLSYCHLIQLDRKTFFSMGLNQALQSNIGQKTAAILMARENINVAYFTHSSRLLDHMADLRLVSKPDTWSIELDKVYVTKGGNDIDAYMSVPDKAFIGTANFTDTTSGAKHSGLNCKYTDFAMGVKFVAQTAQIQLWPEGGFKSLEVLMEKQVEVTERTKQLESAKMKVTLDSEQLKKEKKVNVARVTVALGEAKKAVVDFIKANSKLKDLRDDPEATAALVTYYRSVKNTRGLSVSLTISRRQTIDGQEVVIPFWYPVIP